MIAVNETEEYDRMAAVFSSRRLTPTRTMEWSQPKHRETSCGHNFQIRYPQVNFNLSEGD